MKKFLIAGVATAALMMMATPGAFAFSMNGSAGGGLGGGFHAGSNADTFGDTWGNGSVLKRWSTSESSTGSQAEMIFDGSTDTGLTVGFSTDNFGLATNDNFIKTNGSFTGSSSSSNVSGGFHAGGGGGFSVSASGL